MLRIWDPVPFDTWIRDPGWVKNRDPDPHGSYFRELRNIFFGLKYLNSLMEMLIRDKYPGSATMPIIVWLVGREVPDREGPEQASPASLRHPGQHFRHGGELGRERRRYSSCAFLAVKYNDVFIFFSGFVPDTSLADPLHYITGWIRIRIWIRGSMPRSNGSGSRCGSGSCYFRYWPSQDANKKLMF